MLITPKCLCSNSHNGGRICFDSSNYHTVVLEMKKKQNESIKAFVSEKEVFKFVSLVPRTACAIYDLRNSKKFGVTF